MLIAAQLRGFVGPGDVSGHLEHALAFAGAAPAAPDVAVDLGSGGGLPGLPLASYWSASVWALVESQARRAEFLRDAVERLGLGDRVEVIHDRAERVGRDPAHRGRAALVVARGFAVPAVTAESGSPLLRVGGHLLVSDPPGGRPWPEPALASLGMKVVGMRVDPALVVLQQDEPTPPRFPRRVGIPAKRPLFDVPRET